MFVLTCGTFSIPAALGGTQAMRFLAVDIYRAVATFPLDYAKAAAIGTLLFWISLVGVAFYRFASRVATRFVTVTARGTRMRMVKLRGWRLPALLLIGIYVLLAIVLPYLALIYVAGLVASVLMGLLILRKLYKILFIGASEEDLVLTVESEDLPGLKAKRP